jgi:hypothetical protein
MATKRMYLFKEEAVRTYPNAKDADPNVIGRALWDLTVANQGRLDPEAAVRSARTRNHPLHPFLTWDDKIAGQKWRIEEMRSIIRSVMLVTENDDGKQERRRGWLSVDDRDGVSYRGVEEVLSSNSLQAAVMRRALRDLQAWEDRYRELDDICEMVRAARTRLESRLSSHAGQQQAPA